MSSSERDSDRARSGKTERQQPADRAPSAHDREAEEIKKQIGPGLRSMYANVLSEELPQDLLEVVKAMASKERAAGSNTDSDEEGGDGGE